MQRGAMDIQAMSLALAAATTPPLTHMTPRCPPRYISNPAALVLLTVMYMGCQLAQASHIVLLTTRSWFEGGNGSSNNVSHSLL